MTYDVTYSEQEPLTLEYEQEELRSVEYTELVRGPNGDPGTPGAPGAP